MLSLDSKQTEGEAVKVLERFGFFQIPRCTAVCHSEINCMRGDYYLETVPCHGIRYRLRSVNVRDLQRLVVLRLFTDVTSSRIHAHGKLTTITD